MPLARATADQLSFLLDTNIFITIEPYRGKFEPSIDNATKLAAAIHRSGSKAYLHRANRDDILQTKSTDNREHNLTLLEKYHLLEDVPINKEWYKTFPQPAEGSNDHRDLRLLAVTAANAVDFLVTEDRRLRRRAAKIGLKHRVISIESALEILESFLPRQIQPPPKVTSLKTYQISNNDPIFDNIRSYYPEFEHWLNKIKNEHESRLSWVIKDHDQGQYKGIAILKTNDTLSITENTTKVINAYKLCTFKIDENASGYRYGELLLKTVYRWILGQQHREIPLFVTYSQQMPTDQATRLHEFLSGFGFKEVTSPDTNDTVLLKQFQPDPIDTDTFPEVDFYRTFGPGIIPTTTNFFIVPIQPQWHSLLFPDNIQDDQQLIFDVFDTPTPYGNAIRKAYVCKSPIQKLRPGDTLLFYRSGDSKSVTDIGIVEQTEKMSDVASILSLVGNRTVYTRAQLKKMTENNTRTLLVINFLHDRALTDKWQIQQLQANAVLKSAPQSITEVRTDKGRKWIREQLIEWH